MHRIILGKLIAVLLLLVVLALMLLSCGSGVPAARAHEANNEWLRVYETDRRLTADEAAQYEALTDEQKTEWTKGGKPAPLPLSPRMLDAARDHYQAVRMEAEAAE